MSSTYRKPYLGEELMPGKRRRGRKRRPVDLEKLQRDFWMHFDLEKFANDWRRGVGKRRP